MTVNGPSTDPGSQSPRGNEGGSSNGHSGSGGNKSGDGTVSRTAGDALVRSLGLNPAEFTGYFLNADGEVVGISPLVGGDA